MDDPDTVEPAGKIWDHRVVWNIDPSTTTIPTDRNAAVAVERRNDYGERGYGGPNPPDREHTYRFVVYALDTTLDFEPNASKENLKAVIEGHVLVETRLEATYTPRASIGRIGIDSAARPTGGSPFIGHTTRKPYSQCDFPIARLI